MSLLSGLCCYISVFLGTSPPLSFSGTVCTWVIYKTNKTWIQSYKNCCIAQLEVNNSTVSFSQYFIKHITSSTSTVLLPITFISQLFIVNLFNICMDQYVKHRSCPQPISDVFDLHPAASLESLIIAFFDCYYPAWSLTDTYDGLWCDTELKQSIRDRFIVYDKYHFSMATETERLANRSTH